MIKALIGKLFFCVVLILRRLFSSQLDDDGQIDVVVVKSFKHCCCVFQQETGTFHINVFSSYVKSRES